MNNNLIYYKILHNQLRTLELGKLEYIIFKDIDEWGNIETNAKRYWTLYPLEDCYEANLADLTGLFNEE